MKASGYFREMVGDRILMYNPAALALYRSLKGWEDHHADVHKDCEDAMSQRGQSPPGGMMEEKPSSDAASAAGTNRCSCAFCTPYGCRCCGGVKRAGFIAPRLERRPQTFRDHPDIAALTEVHGALDEVEAPKESGGVRLAAAGRIRAFNSESITAINRMREAVLVAGEAIGEALAMDARLDATVAEHLRRAYVMAQERSRE